MDQQSENGYWVLYERYDEESFDLIVHEYTELLFELYDDELDDMLYEHILIIHQQHDAVVEL
jgi:hypothetical protein